VWVNAVATEGMVPTFCIMLGDLNRIKKVLGTKKMRSPSIPFRYQKV